MAGFSNELNVRVIVSLLLGNMVKGFNITGALLGGAGSMCASDAFFFFFGLNTWLLLLMVGPDVYF
jgi:hypothetical protein